MCYRPLFPHRHMRDQGVPGRTPTDRAMPYGLRSSTAANGVMGDRDGHGVKRTAPPSGSRGTPWTQVVRSKEAANACVWRPQVTVPVANWLVPAISPRRFRWCPARWQHAEAGCPGSGSHRFQPRHPRADNPEGSARTLGRSYPSGTSSTARCTAAVRLGASSFRKMLLTCFLAVRSVMNRR